MKHCHLLLMMLTHLDFLPRASRLARLDLCGEVVVEGSRVGSAYRDHSMRDLEKFGFHMMALHLMLGVDDGMMNSGSLDRFLNHYYCLNC